MTEPRHTADTITDDALDELYAERDALLVELDGRGEEARERWIEKQLAATSIKSMDFRNGIDMELAPARDMVAAWVGAARTMLGDAENYTETPIEMVVKVAEEPERYAFVLQRVGKLTPHQARQAAEERAEQAEAERDAVYRERARLVAHLASLYPSHIGHTDPTAPDWAVLIVEAPTGQLSWHIAERDMDLFAHVQPTNRICRGWDSHTTDEKYERLHALTRGEGHTLFRVEHAEAAVARARALHRPVEHRGQFICAECSAYDGTGSTDNPPAAWPCRTNTALGRPTTAGTEGTNTPMRKEV
jgi:hypothetical protein